MLLSSSTSFSPIQIPTFPMASDHHHCHCQPPNPTPPATTCYCTMCCTTTLYSSPPPPPPPPSDPPLHCLSSHLHHHHHPPPQTHLHAPPQNHHNIHAQSYDYHPPPQIHKKHQLIQKYRQQNAEEDSPSVDSTVSSLIHRIAALESSLRRRSKQSTGSSSLRDAAARTIQTHFRAFLVRRSVTLRHLKDLAYIKSALNNLKSSVSNKTHFDFHLLSRESMNLLIKLDSIQGSDPMIRDGKRSISRDLIRFMELIDEISTESRVISVKNVRFHKNGKNSVILQREHKITASGSSKIPENLKTQMKKSNKVSSIPKVKEEKVESLVVEKPRIHRNGALMKSEVKVKKNVSFDEKGNVYRLINRNHSPVSSDQSDDSTGDDEEVEEIGVSSKEPEIEEEDSSEMSENEMDPRKNLATRIDHTTNNTNKKNQPDQEDEDEDEEDEDEDEEEEDSFVFSAPLPAKMEYRVDSANKKQIKR